MTSLLIGCGNLGRIILNGFNSSKKKIVVLEKNRGVINELGKNYKNVKFINSLNKVDLKKINFILLCVKPQDSKKILNEIKSLCNKSHTIISFIAGLQTHTISKLVSSNCSIARIMPNIYISSNNSSSAIFSKNKTLGFKNKITKEFKCFGSFVWLNDEKKMNFFTAMFGGGPAYFLYLIQCFHKLIKKNGISTNDSLSLLISLLEGTLVQLKSGNINFNEFIKKVASPGGTTQEALDILTKDQALLNLLEKAINSAKDKSNKIAKQF